MVVSILIIAVVLVVLGATLLFLSTQTDQQATAIARLLKTWSNIRFLMTRSPRDGDLVKLEPYESHNTPLLKTIRLQAKRDAWWAGDHTVPGSAFRVHVPPDSIARLPFRCAWTSVRYLDSSAFCLRTDNTDANDIKILQRCARWQLDFFDRDQLRSRDSYTLNCHVAVHTAVDISTSEEALLDRLFENLSSFLAQVRETVAGLLRHEFQSRDYREAMYETPQIIDALNQAIIEHRGLREILELIQIQFTAIVIKPRKEAELKFHARFQQKVEKLQTVRHARVETEETAISALESKTTAVVGETQTTLEAMDTNIERQLDQTTESVGQNLLSLRTDDELHDAVRDLFPREELEQSVEKVAAVCSRVRRLLHEWNAKQRELVNAVAVEDPDTEEEV